MTQYIVGAAPDLFKAAIPNYALPLQVYLLPYGFVSAYISSRLTRLHDISFDLVSNNFRDT